MTEQWAHGEAHCFHTDRRSFLITFIKDDSHFLVIQKNMGLKVLVTVSSESIGVYFFHSQNPGVLGFRTLWLQQEVGLIGTKLFFVTWKGSFVSAEQRRALSPNLTCAHLWKCGTRGPGPSGHKSLTCGLQSVFSRMNSSEA